MGRAVTAALLAVLALTLASAAQAAAAVPSVSSIAPAFGPPAGGTAVTILGSHFAEVSGVTFGSAPATSFTVDSSNEITATSPAAEAGAYDVTVTSPSGTSATSSADVFDYATAPGAPTQVSATIEGDQASVSFGPADANGSAITSYKVTASPGGATSEGTSSPIVVAGLQDGTEYTFTVTATNAVGAGPASEPSAPVHTIEPTSIEIFPSPLSSHFGEPVRFDTLVSAANGTIPSGTVQFSLDGVELGEADPLVEGGHLSEPLEETFDVGTMLVASYSGNADLAASTTSLQPDIEPAGTSVALRSSANPQVAGQPVTITATVTNTETAFPPFGAVQFVVNGSPVLEPLNLSPEGKAAIIGHLPSGAYSIEARYHDDTGEPADFRDSVGSLSQVVEAAGVLSAAPAPTASPTATQGVQGVQVTAAPTSTPANNALIIGRPVVSRSGRITLSVRTVDPGRLTFLARMRPADLAKARPAIIYGRGSANAGGGSKAIKLTIAPDAKAKAALASGQAIHLRILVTFQSRKGGRAKSVVVSTTLTGKSHALTAGLPGR